MHEDVLQRSNFIKGKSFSFNNKINFRSHPTIAKEVRIRTYHYELLNLKDKLKNNGIKKIPNKKCLIAYVPGKTAKAVQLSPLSYALLSLSTGKKSIQDIVFQCLGPKERTKRASNIILDKFRFLQQEGVLSISNSA